MPYYKDKTNGVHHLDSVEFEHLLPPGCVQIDDQEAEALQNPTPTTAQVITEYTNAVQQHLDDFARTRGYDSMLSACTYANSDVAKFKAEGDYAVAARDETWAKCYDMLSDVESGTRQPPSMDELFAELPILAWP